MRPAELLDTDVAVLGPRLMESARAAFDWWLGELRELAPAGLIRSAASPLLIAERDAAGDYLLVRRDGRVRRHVPGRAPVRAALRLPSEVLLVRHLQTPRLPERDLRRMLTLDIDRLTPFRAEEVYLDVAPLAPAAEGEVSRPALLGVAPRASADRALARARAAGIEPVAMIPAEEGASGLDLLPAMRAAGALGPGRRTSVYAWGVVALLVAVNVGCWVWRDSESLAELKAAVAAQQPQVRRVVSLRSAVAVEAQRRRLVATALAADQPLQALDALSRALPDGAWVQRASFAQTAVRLAGEHQPGLDVVAALRRDPAFQNVQTASADPNGTASAGSPTADPFDVSADLAPPAAPR